MGARQVDHTIDDDQRHMNALWGLNPSRDELRPTSSMGNSLIERPYKQKDAINYWS
jgi:hypothetical protein